MNNAYLALEEETVSQRIFHNLPESLQQCPTRKHPVRSAAGEPTNGPVRKENKTRVIFQKGRNSLMAAFPQRPPLYKGHFQFVPVDKKSIP